MEKRFIWKNVTGKNTALLCVQAAFLLAAVGCVAPGPSREEQKAQMQADIKKLASLPLNEFLPMYFTGTSGQYNTIVITTLPVYGEILRPRRILETYCEDNNAVLSRIPYSQVDSYSDISPDAFADLRTVENAKAMYHMDMTGGVAVSEIAGAVREGAFGVFECRDLNAKQTLWKARVEQGESLPVNLEHPARTKIQLKISRVK